MTQFAVFNYLNSHVVEKENIVYNCSQEAQLHCDVFRQWGAKNIARTQTRSLPKRNPSLTKKSFNGDRFGRIPAGGFREKMSLKIDEI